MTFHRQGLESMKGGPWELALEFGSRRTKAYIPRAPSGRASENCQQSELTRQVSSKKIGHINGYSTDSKEKG